MHFNSITGNIDRGAMESKWRQLGTFKLNELITDTSIKDISITKFWIMLSQVTNACEEYQFGELSNFALKMISLPISNAVVECVFSIMNASKT